MFFISSDIKQSSERENSRDGARRTRTRSDAASASDRLETVKINWMIFQVAFLRLIGSRLFFSFLSQLLIKIILSGR